MRVFLHNLLFLLVIAPAVRADVLETAAQYPEMGNVPPGSSGTAPVPFYFPRLHTVSEWLTQADQNLDQVALVIAAAGPDWASAGSSATSVQVSETSSTDALNQPWLLSIPGSAYASAAPNPIFHSVDRDVNFGLQHPGFQSPLRQIYLERCRLALRQFLRKSHAISSAAAASGAPHLQVCGVLDGLVSVLQQSQSGGRLLAFADPAFSTELQRISVPELGLASQPFPLLTVELPGKPFRPFGTLQSQWQRFQAVLVDLQVVTHMRLLGHQAGFTGGIRQPARANSALLPAMGLGLILFAFVAMRFRRTAH